MTGKTKTIGFVAVVLTIIAFFAIGLAYKNQAQAQTAGLQFLTTWQAKSYAPPQYRGKTMPTGGSRVTVAFDLVNLGRVVDLSQQTINWYLSGNILGSGKGMQTLTFLAPDDGSGAMPITIELPDYTNQLLLAAVNIPLAKPEAVIEAPYPNGVFSGYSPQVRGVPYFFNVSSLSRLNFAWTVNGETPQNAEDPSNLAISLNQDVRPGSTIDVRLTLRDPNSALTFAEDEVTLIVGQ